MEMFGPRSLSPRPRFPALRSGPLCRSAASGHSLSARALLAPPPFLAVRTPSHLVLVLLFVARPSPGDSAVCVRCRPHPLHSRFVPRDGAKLPYSRLGCHAAGDRGSGSGPRACLMVVMGDPWGSFKGFGDRARAFSFLNILLGENRKEQPP